MAQHDLEQEAAGHLAASDSRLRVPLPVHLTRWKSLELPHNKHDQDPEPGISSQSTLQVNKSAACLGTREASSSMEEPLPKYRRGWMNKLRWECLSVYRRLNLCVLAINLTIITIFAAQGKLTKFAPGDVSIALTANITTAVVFRQEYVVNLLFVLFSCCPPSWPLRIRGLAAKIYHFGGVHSGAGVSALIWLILFDISLGLHYASESVNSGGHKAVVTITVLLNVLLSLVVLTAYPTFRNNYHNTWELIHRFGGWTSVALFWVNFGLLADADRQRYRPQETISTMLITAPVFWMLLVISVCLIAPWLRLRKVRLHAELQSRHAVRLHFTYTNLPLCAAPRLSTSPLMEWHSFAGIPEENGLGFSVLVSSAGDWTKRLIANPPRTIWTRGIPVRGVLHVAPMFRKVILVATGSGIGPVLSLLYARAVDCRILWCTRDPFETYRPEVVSKVLEADPKAEIVKRLKGQGDPDLGRIAYHMYRESGAEAVFIISNRQGCYQGRMWLESRGVLVFTPIFDS